MPQGKLSAFFLTVMALEPIKAQVPSGIDPDTYCVRYYGNLEAHIDVAEAVPERNYDDEECPRSWDFAEIAYSNGAILNICPPGNNWSGVPQGARLKASIFLGGGPNEAHLAIVMRLEDLYITGGDVPVSEKSNDLPVLRRGVPYEFEDIAWSVNGTQSAMIKGGSNESSGNSSASLFCGRMDEDSHKDQGRYCGTPKDIDSQDGCWGQQTFELNPQTPLNFSLWFDNLDAHMTIWTTGEYLGTNRSGSGSNSSANFTFEGGSPYFPRPNGNFWFNAYRSAQEEEKHYIYNDTRIIAGDEGLPVFLNKTHGRYAFENSSYLSPQGKEEGSSAAGKFFADGPGIWSSLLMGVLFVEGMDVLLA